MRSGPKFADHLIHWLTKGNAMECEELEFSKNLYVFAGDKVTGEGMVIYDTKAHAVYEIDDGSNWDAVASNVNDTWKELMPDKAGTSVRRPQTTAPGGKMAAVRLFI